MARAYYGAYVVLNFVANHSPAYPWPRWPNGTLKPMLPHDSAGRAVAWIHGAARNPRTVLAGVATPRAAMQELFSQRITADYRTALEASPELASRLLRNANELARVLLGEANRVKGNPGHITV